jgi:hypothetical protein
MTDRMSSLATPSKCRKKDVAESLRGNLAVAMSDYPRQLRPGVDKPLVDADNRVLPLVGAKMYLQHQREPA